MSLEVLKDILSECKDKFKYKAESPGLDYWQTPLELEKVKEGDCEDLSVWVISRASAMGIVGSLYLVWGVDFNNQGHSWVEYEDETGKRYWLDPVLQRGPLGIEKWRYIPWMAAKYNGELFSERFVYRAKLEKKLDRDNLDYRPINSI